MTFNIKALDAFRTANLQGADAIANFGKDNRITQKGTYRGKIGTLFRSPTTASANNATRTELLRSLGDAFGLDGIGRNAKGVTTFSKDFMDKLSKLLGPEFRRNDFGVGDDGTVNSGKPLTQRRISAIVKQAALVGKGEYDYDTYKAKLDYVRGQLTAMKVKPTDDYAKEAATRLFAKVEKLMNFAQKDLPGLIDIHYLYDDKKPAGPDNVKYVFTGKGMSGPDQYYPPLESYTQVTDYIKDNLHEMFHISENILPKKAFASFNELTDPGKQIKDYLNLAIQNFVTTAIDLFIDAEKAGKTMEFLNTTSRTWPCIEGTTSDLTDFRLKNLPLEDMGPVATHDKNQPLNQCIGREIAVLMENDKSINDWSQVADRVKKNLVGVVRPIDIPEKHVSMANDGTELTTYEFKPLLGETGKPVVRAITEADIDALGEAVMDTILYG